jgi:hypothetical protein
MPNENQPLPGDGGPKRNCANCAFSIEVREPPPSIQKQRVCRWGPPAVVPIYSPQGITLQVLHPPVNETVLCNQHRLAVEIANAIPGPKEGPAN